MSAIFDGDLYEEDLPVMLNDYLGYLLAVKGRSLNTITGYKIDLKLFIKYMAYIKKFKHKIDADAIDDIDISQIDESFFSSIRLGDLYSFVNYITLNRNNGTHARARKVAAVKSYFNYLETKAKIIKENPARELESPKINKRQPIYLTLDQSRNLLSSIDGRHKERDYAIITIFLNCGLRLSELVGIDISKIRTDTLTVIGKGNKERTVYLNAACIKALENYMIVRPKQGVPEEHKDALFLSERKKRIDKRTVELLVKKYILNTTGIVGNKVTPHKLRHTAATLMYKHGHVDIRALQEILGHESVSTTQIYTHLDEDKLRSAVNANPLAEEEQL